MKTKTKLSLNRETVISLTGQSTSTIKGGAKNTNLQCPWQLTDECQSDFAC